jgi:hypothetical protein
MVNRSLFNRQAQPSQAKWSSLSNREINYNRVLSPIDTNTQQSLFQEYLFGIPLIHFYVSV